MPVEYFHVVFTIPEEMARIAYYNKEIVYGILFRAAAETVSTIAADPKHLGAEPGFLGILHTWGQNLSHHPHIHFVVPGGGLSPDYNNWIPCRPGFFLPVRVLSRLFRRLFLEQLQTAFLKGQLLFPGDIGHLERQSEFLRCLEPIRKSEWVVYSKPPFGGPQQVLAYLGRYTHRTAISNQRILDADDGTVTFQWNDYRHKDKSKSRKMTLDAHEFIRRFLVHTLPPGFQRIRHFGFLANRHRREKLERCRELLCQSSPVADTVRQVQPAPKPPGQCPKCGKGPVVRLGVLPAFHWPNRPPDSS